MAIPGRMAEALLQLVAPAPPRPHRGDMAPSEPLADNGIGQAAMHLSIHPDSMAGLSGESICAQQ
ncbi:hypothetical protein X011_01330 [Mycobacterium tuberculosis variant microti OV254]|nr:hypothetical protein X011_01330 [Mycobacterium tuberculosis variant microti OV254]BBX42101.1 hypothetical protein MSIM_35520 [Mycobacterium simiae]